MILEFMLRVVRGNFPVLALAMLMTACADPDHREPFCVLSETTPKLLIVAVGNPRADQMQAYICQDGCIRANDSEGEVVVCRENP